MDQQDVFDSLYMQILQQGRGIDPLFNSLFSFMRRKSDFYKQSDAALEGLLKAFNTHKQKFQEDELKEKQKKQKLELQKQKEEKEKKEKEVLKNVSTGTTSGSSGTSGVKEITKEEFERRKQLEKEGLNNINTEVTEEPKVTEKKDEKKEKKEEKDDEKDEAKERMKKCAQMDQSLRQELLKKTAHLEDKNGGRTRNYTWIQPQVENFEMFIPIDNNCAGSDIKIDFGSKTLKVKVKGEVLVDGELFAPMNSDSFIWVLDEIKGKKTIVITFDKLYKMAWWDYVIKGDELLTLSKVNPDASKLSDLDPSMRPDIEKMMLENSMKMQGKPFHKDPKTNDMLGKFMKEHPEMDFSKAKFG
jgi:hypothetical protein